MDKYYRVRIITDGESYVCIHFFPWSRKGNRADFLHKETVCSLPTVNKSNLVIYMPPWSSFSEVCGGSDVHSGRFSRFCVGSLCSHSLNPLLSIVLEFFYMITMPPAVLRLCLKLKFCCRLSKRHSRSFGAVECYSLCVAAEHSVPGRWQIWTRPGSFSKEVLVLDRGS